MAKKDYTYGELVEILQYNEKESYMLMPNEVVCTLAKTDLINGGNKSEHISVAYTYLYLNTWLYRYAKYGQVELDMLTVKELKNMIDISPTGTGFNYLFKKNGVLDELGLTKTKSFTEAPVQWHLNDDNDVWFEEFNSMSDYLKDVYSDGKSLKRRQIKYPTLALEERTPIEDLETNGTFYNSGKEYTHHVSFEVFLKTMTTDELGPIAFYLYSFIRSRYGINQQVTISLDTIVKESGLRPTTVNKYMLLLRQYGLMGAKIQNYVVGRDIYAEGTETEANTYWVYESDFNFEKEDVDVRKVVSIFNLEGIKFTTKALGEKEAIWDKAKKKKRE